MRHPTSLRATPGGRTLARLSTKTEFGSPETVWVVHRVPGWLGVVATQAGNGRVGWIEQGAVALSPVSWELKVSLGARRLTVLDAGKVVRQFTVAIGRPGAPTPTGRFAVTDRLLTGNDGGPYGCCILALSAHSPHAIQGWTGGDRIAIHSTPDVTSIGEAASHGCVRVTLAAGALAPGSHPARHAHADQQLTTRRRAARPFSASSHRMCKAGVIPITTSCIDSSIVGTFTGRSSRRAPAGA